MKKGISGIIGIMGFLFLFSHVGYAANTSYIDEACFREKAILSPSEEIFITAPYQDIFATQWGQELEIFFYDWKYKYIPFSSNISQQEIASSYKNIYSFWDIDTAETTQIIVSLKEKIQKEDFSMNFLYDSQYYSPKFYISENNQWSYFQVLQNDISDYSPTHIKISFFPKGNESIREIIRIRNLSIIRNTSVWSIIPQGASELITLYAGNTCKRIQEDISIGTSSYNWEFFTPIFRENPAYRENNTDSDNDSIPDRRDNCKTLSNRDQKDINQNRVWDACEFDSDKDTVPDEVDNCRNTMNPDQADRDADGIGDVCDNCELYNPDQFDTDSNKMGDRCDSAKKYLEENDTDGDKVENYRDNCPNIANPLQEDDDSDGIGNVCDNCKSYQNPFQEDENKNGIGDVCEDSDADGLEWLQDNCPTITNPEQADDDNDGIGNVCEDDDRDGVILISDNCPYVYNPDQSDIDNDGLGDVCDESDDRFLESNKAIFIILMILAILWFIAGIYSMARKIQK